MKISHETLTVFSDTNLQEVYVLSSGIKLTLAEDEARKLSHELASLLQRSSAQTRGASQLGSAVSNSSPATARDAVDEKAISTGIQRILGRAS